MDVDNENILGLTLSNNAADLVNDIDIIPGVAIDSTQTVQLILSSGLTKRLDAAWASGTNAGGLDTGSKAISTTYHVFLISTAVGIVDALFSTSPTNPVMPSSYFYQRRLGSIITDASGSIRPFLQTGGDFNYVGPRPGTGGFSSATLALTVVQGIPAGIKVKAEILTGMMSTAPATNISYCTVRDPDLGVPLTADENTSPYYHSAALTAPPIKVWTDAAAQVYTWDNSANAPLISLTTMGWFDPRSFA